MPTRAYFDALNDSKRHHAESKTFSGMLMRPHAPFIKEIIDRLGCKSVLDFGCGKGLQYEWRNADPAGSIPVGMTIEEFCGVPVTKYDPAVPGLDREPVGKFDLVLCTHVLGSIPVSDLNWAVDRLYSLARKAIYVAEKIGPVKKKVLSAPQQHPIGWSSARWMTAVKRERPEIELTLALREMRDGIVKTDRYRL